MSPEDFAEDYAKEFEGNWRRFPSFAWRDAPDDATAWGVFNTHNRDSGLLAQSNASVFQRELEASCFEEDVQAEHANHWACGWVDGFAVRVRAADSGAFTPAFIKLVELVTALESYPVLDENDYSQREYDAAVEAIEQELHALGAGWNENSAGPGDVFGWLWDHEQEELENRDDQGAAPSREAVARACDALDITYDREEEREPLLEERS